MNEAQEYIVRVNQDDDGSFVAEVLDLPGCFATGWTLDELREAVEEAINLYLHDDPESGKLESFEPLPEGPTRRPMQIGELRVKVPA
jgi:predicted RNase H-like HicB family nuclease